MICRHCGEPFASRSRRCRRRASSRLDPPATVRGRNPSRIRLRPAARHRGGRLLLARCPHRGRPVRCTWHLLWSRNDLTDNRGAFYSGTNLYALAALRESNRRGRGSLTFATSSSSPSLPSSRERAKRHQLVRVSGTQRARSELLRAPGLLRMERLRAVQSGRSMPLSFPRRGSVAHRAPTRCSTRTLTSTSPTEPASADFVPLPDNFCRLCVHRSALRLEHLLFRHEPLSGGVARGDHRMSTEAVVDRVDTGSFRIAARYERLLTTCSVNAAESPRTTA